MKLIALALIFSVFSLSLVGCSSETTPQAASTAELEKYLRDNPVLPPEETYDVE